MCLVTAGRRRVCCWAAVTEACTSRRARAGWCLLPLVALLGFATVAWAGDQSGEADSGINASWATALSRPALPSNGPLLRERLAGAGVIVHGRVSMRESFDGGALQLARVEVEQAWPPLDQRSIGIVDLRGALRRQLLPPAGTSLVAALDVAPGYSYLRNHLPEGNYYVSPANGDGFYAGLDSVAAAALAAWLAHGDAEPFAVTRAHAMALLASGDARLTRAALAELSRVPVPDSLSQDEWEHVAMVMQEGLPAKGMLALQLATWGLTPALDYLQSGEVDDIVTRSRVLQARILLGDMPEADVMIEASRAGSPADRAGAVRVLGLLPDEQALARAGAMATGDPHPGVRRVAIRALVDQADYHDTPAALGWLEQAYDSEEAMLRSAAMQALTARDDDIAARLVRLAEDAGVGVARNYAAGLLVLRLGMDDPRVQRLRQETEDVAVRRILEEGILSTEGFHSHGPDLDRSPGHGHGHGHGHSHEHGHSH